MKKFRTVKVATVSMSHLTHDIYTAFLAPLLPFLIQKHGLSYFMVSLLIVVMRAPALANIVFGLMSDRKGFKYLIVITPAITAITMSFIPVLDHYMHIYILVFIAGTSSALYHVPAPVIIREMAGDKIGRGMSFFMFSGELARTLGPIIILGAITWLGINYSWLIFIPGVIIAVLLYFQVRNIKTAEPPNKISKFESFGVVMREMKPILPVMSGLIVSKAFLLLALTSFLPTFISSKGGELWLAGISLSVLELSGAAGAMISGTLSDKIGRRNVMLISSIAAPIFLVAFVFADGWVAFPMLIILGLLAFSATPVIMAWVLDSDTEYPATANSVFMTINFFSSSVVALLFGHLGDIIDLETTYLISAGISFIGVFFALKMPKEELNS